MIFFSEIHLTRIKLKFLLNMPTFNDLKNRETHVGKKRAPVVKFQDIERKKCSKLVHPDTQKLMAMISSFKATCTASDTKTFDMWLLQLKLSKEMVLIAAGLLEFLDEITELEELGMDSKTDIIPPIDSMIEECQDLILDSENQPWKAVAERDVKTNLFLDAVLSAMKKAVAMVFRSKKWIKTEERFDLLYACRCLFEAADDLLKSVTYDGDFLELDSELEALMEDAICKCDDQHLDGYLDVDQDNEEEEEEDDELADEDEEDESDEDDD